MAEVGIVVHELEPLFDRESTVLLLGTMPSPKSREIGFYYGHPRNRFWPVMAEILGAPYPESREEKKALVLKNHIAVWDVLASCEIEGADDASIRNPVPNDLSRILNQASIRAIFTTGTKAGVLYRKYCLPRTGIPAIVLPSTSPANCRTSFEELVAAYRKILAYR